MSTRSNIILTQQNEEPIILYRHMDGYLSSAAVDLIDALLKCNKLVKGQVNRKDFASTLQTITSGYRNKKQYELVEERMGGTEFQYRIDFKKNCCKFFAWSVNWETNVRERLLECFVITFYCNRTDIAEVCETEELKYALDPSLEPINLVIAT